MKRCVPVAVCHVDHKLQQLRGDGGEGTHIGLDNGCVRCFVTGHAQPLLQHSGVGGPLRSDTMSTIRETYNDIKVGNQTSGERQDVFSLSQIYSTAKSFLVLRFRDAKHILYCKELITCS